MARRRSSGTDEDVVLFVGGLILSAILTPIIAAVDQPWFGVDLAWWMCAVVALALVFGGVVIINASSD